MVILINKTSPIKISLIVCTSSVIFSLIYYNQTLSVFTRRVIIISFSSGIMILFCYCASLCSHETSTKPSTSYLTISIMLIILTLRVILFKSPITVNNRTTPTFLKASLMQNSRLLIFLIAVVIIVIITINERIYDPQKKIIKTY